jgi:glutamine amidotransferase
MDWHGLPLEPLNPDLMPQKIAIIDYSLGNVHSIVKKILRLNAQPLVCSTAEELKKADKIILPGVGHFGTAMQQLRQTALLETLEAEVLQKKKPVLGICLGMQLMARQSEEAPDCAGLGWIDAQVVRFRHQDSRQFRVPHTGWNQCVFKADNLLAKGIEQGAEFYFTHSFHLDKTSEACVLAESVYDYTFPSMIQQQHIFGVQFHPEKSHQAGERMFANFLSL